MLANYHMTENKYLESISNNGLIPQQGIRSNLIGDSKNAIFYSQGYQGVIAMFFMMIEKFMEYKGSTGDIHIDSYNIIVEMVRSKQKQGKEVSDYLIDTMEKEKRIVEVIDIVRASSNWKEFLGEGVCLKIVNINEDNSNFPGFSFYNSWTTSRIPPEDIYVVTLENKKTGQVLTSKYDIINYFISMISLESMGKALYDTDSKERENHLLWQIMSQYYNDNRNLFKSYFEDFDIIEVPILSYLNKNENQLKGK